MTGTHADGGPRLRKDVRAFVRGGGGLCARRGSAGHRKRPAGLGRTRRRSSPTRRGMVRGRPANEGKEGRPAGGRGIAHRRAAGGGRAARPAVRGAAGDGILVSRGGARGLAAACRRRGVTSELRKDRTRRKGAAAARWRPASAMPAGLTPHLVEEEVARLPEVVPGKEKAGWPIGIGKEGGREAEEEVAAVAEAPWSCACCSRSLTSSKVAPSKSTVIVI